MKSSRCKKHSTALNNRLWVGVRLIRKSEWVAFHRNCFLVSTLLNVPTFTATHTITYYSTKFKFFLSLLSKSASLIEFGPLVPLKTML